MMSKKASRTARLLTTASVLLVAVYVVLAVLLASPWRALGFELFGVVILWSSYAGRFALMSPRALAPEVLWFEIVSRLQPPPRGALVFTGSSTIAHWSTLEEDMAPLRVLNRGINGARLHQIAYYADRIILPHAPRGVIVYAGENDIAGFLGSPKRTPQQVLAAFRDLCERLHARLPALPISFISIKPPKRRNSSAPAFREANERVRAYCAADSRLTFIDVSSALVDEGGEPREDIFEKDGIHLNARGYEALTSVVKPVLARLFAGAS
jgi:lysophospholipase L1-like esterase